MSDIRDIFGKVAARLEPKGPFGLTVKAATKLAQSRKEQRDSQVGATAYPTLAECRELDSPRSYARRLAHEAENNPAIASLGMSMAERTHWLKQHAEKWARMAEKRRAAQASNQEATPDGDL